MSQKKSQELQSLISTLWESFCSAIEKENTSLNLGDLPLQTLETVWAGSDFVAQSCIRHPEMLLELVHSNDLNTTYEKNRYSTSLSRLLLEVTEETALLDTLRHFRRREMVRIAWRDLAQQAPLNETLADLSALADACVNETLLLLHQWLSKTYGMPTDESAVPQKMIVIAMGKLGAHELNFSSDIDLIFAYPSQGQTVGTSKSLSNAEYFTKLGQHLINALSALTPQGYVFRTDVRLRPFGDSGPLAMSFDAMEAYYQTHGRDWERYAWVKARIISGDVTAGKQLMKIMRPFVYRRYLDFSAFKTLRELKQSINHDVQRRKKENNIKLGAGGIREIEFIGQAFQLIRGGREPELQERSILKILALLGQNNYLPKHVVNTLTEAYIFLRLTENRLQMMEDKQVHTLPENQLNRERLAFSMEFSNWQTFTAALEQHLNQVHSHFEQVFDAPQTDHLTQFSDIWQASAHSEHIITLLTQAGYDHNTAVEISKILTQLHHSSHYKNLTVTAKERFDRLMPLLLGAALNQSQSIKPLQRLIQFIETIARRSAYFSLLTENPIALSQLVQLNLACPWITEQLIRHPLLLDELLDPRVLYSPLDKTSMEIELALQLQQIKQSDDLERQMDVLRQFKNAHVLRIAATDIMEKLPLMNVSDYLTAIAETVLQQALQLALGRLTQKHGMPQQRDTSTDVAFAIIGYGKLGGIELGYGSDLDLVFLYDDAHSEQQTTGLKPISHAQFFTRLGQSIIHIINTLTASGVLYEVDMRLRPNGSSGLLVSSLDAFSTYQLSSAWTWEHQALIRARFIAGNDNGELCDKFKAVRQKVLSEKEPSKTLKQDIKKMREQMRQSLTSRQPDKFDLKHSAGGIVDIEFLVQYGVLANAHKHPELLRWTDHLCLLEALTKISFFTDEEFKQLSHAYRSYRHAGHHQVLQGKKALVDDQKFKEERDQVKTIWQKLMGNFPLLTEVEEGGS